MIRGASLSGWYFPWRVSAALSYGKATSAPCAPVGTERHGDSDQALAGAVHPIRASVLINV